MLHDAFDFSLYVVSQYLHRGVAAEVMRFLTTPASHKIQRKQFDEDMEKSHGLCGQNGVDMFHEVIEVIAARNTLYIISIHFIDAIMLWHFMIFQYMGVSENVVYPIVPNGFADHYPYEKRLAIIGNINPTFSGPNPYINSILTNSILTNII